jgi:hypothetical protein
MNDKNPFEDAPVIFSYTRAQAIEDGVLVDLTDWAKETGFKVPVACTAAVWNGYVVPPQGTESLGQMARVLPPSRPAGRAGPRLGSGVLLQSGSPGARRRQPSFDPTTRPAAIAAEHRPATPSAQRSCDATGTSARRRRPSNNSAYRIARSSRQTHPRTAATHAPPRESVRHPCSRSCQESKSLS